MSRARSRYSQVFIEMADRIDGGRRCAAPDHGDNPGPVRGIKLTRRRTRVPWIYLVYHARSRRPGFVRRGRAIASSVAWQSAISPSTKPGADPELVEGSAIRNSS